MLTGQDKADLNDSTKRKNFPYNLYRHALPIAIQHKYRLFENSEPVDE